MNPSRSGAARRRWLRPPVWVCAIGLLFAGYPPGGSALTTDREQPIHIEADRVQIDDAKGVSVYTGNVVYTQGTIRLEADTVHLYYTQTPERRIDRLEADGNPAHFRQRLEGQDEDVRAEALHFEYFAEPGRLILTHDAHVWQLNTAFSGDVIEYNAVQERISAAGAGEGRVQVVIQPEPGKTNGNGSAEPR